MERVRSLLNSLQGQQATKARDLEQHLRELSEALDGIVAEVEALREAGDAETQGRLRDALARHQALLDNAVDAIITIDSRGSIQSVNPAVERLFGYSPQELLGNNVSLLMPSPYREEHDGYIGRYLETGERRIIGIGREVWARRKDGTVFPIDLAVSEVVVGGERTFMGTIRDMTQRKEAEEALRQERDFAQRLVDTAHAIVLVLDVEGRIVRYNRYTEELTGYSLEEVAGERWIDLFLPRQERSGAWETFAATLGGALVRGAANRILVRGGAECLVEWYASPMRGPDEEVSGVLAVGLDVTQRAQLEEQFRQAQKMEAIGRLAGSVAHDFNTVLGSILGYSEVLLEDLGSGPASRAVQQIHRAAERGAALTRQLLALSRRQPAGPQACDADGVLSELDDMLVRLVGERVELRQQLAAAGASVLLPPGQLEQIVLNLVVNARDALEAGHGEVEVRTQAIELDPESAGSLLLPAGSYFALSVSDTGCGMVEEVRRRCFDPFFTTKEAGKGTGLGLSTVYGIVQGAGGQIRLESSPGKGTTVSIYLPLSGETEKKPSTAPRAGRVAGGAEVVLLVEDDEMFRDLISELLRDQGYTVLAAGSPSEALEVAQRHPRGVDLLLSDLMLPEMTGAALAERLASQRPEVRVVLMSGYSDPDTEASLPADVPILHKPFPTRDLLRLVRQVLDGEGG
jgi:PAS domain S-box-containing protein